MQLLVISNLAVLLSQGKGAMESTTMTNTTTRGSCYLHRVRNGTDGGSNDKRSGTADDFNPARREVGARSRPEAQGS
jgi:hypothetical protein